MESLRKLRRVFSKKGVGIVAPKPRDKRLRHSQSMPLVNIYAQSKPLYKGKHPLKVSDVQLVVDSHGCPNALVQHPAFDPVVEQTTFSGPIKKPSRKDVLDLFPAPPSLVTPLPRRPKVTAPPLYDELYNDFLHPNPAFDRQQLPSAARAEMSTSSHRSPGVVQAQDFTKTALFRDGYQEGDRTLMTHSNYSTKSLGAVAIRIKEGPERRVVVNRPAGHEHRDTHSAASPGSHMDATPGPPTSSRRHGQPRQRQTSTTRHGAEFGYIDQADRHYHKIPGSTSRSRPPKSSYCP